jgi:hypothetical protein
VARLSLGEGKGKWRMLRRVLKKKRFTFADARSTTRLDRAHFDWLAGNGFFAPAGDGVYAVTAAGRAAADLGLYEWEREPDAPPGPRLPRR